jgi:hypothetical protein
MLFFDVGESTVESRFRGTGLGSDALRDLTPGAIFHDDLGAFLDFGQHGVSVAGEFSLGDADGRHLP